MPQLNAAFPIVESGRMTDAFRDQMNRFNDNLPITGSGSPEGVVLAPQFSLYINTAGTTGSIEYRKMQTDIGGDKTMGWVAV